MTSTTMQPVVIAFLTHNLIVVEVSSQIGQIVSLESLFSSQPEVRKNHMYNCKGTFFYCVCVHVCV